MSPNPISAAAAWAATLTLDVVVITLAALVLAWQQYCPAGVASCPAPADRPGHEAVVLAVLLAVLLLSGVLALLRGRVVVAALQVVLVVALGAAAQQTLPPAFAQLRAYAHLSSAVR